MHQRSSSVASRRTSPFFAGAFAGAMLASRAMATAPVIYEWVGECKSIPQDWVCEDCANGNWSPSGQPGPTDTARIAVAAVYARGCEKSVNVLEVVDGGFLTIRTDFAVGQSATVAGVGFGDGSTFSSTIATAGPFVMTGSVNSWSRGILTGVGEFQVAPGAILFISPATTEKSLDGTRLVNDGLVNSTSAFNLENAAEIENNGTWTIAAGNLGGTTGPNQNGHFENHGTLACVGPGNDIYTAIPIASDGIIRSENREFYIASGGDHAGGRYEVADGGTIVLSGFDVGGVAHGVHVTGAVDATGQGNLKLVRETTFIDAGGTLDATLETIEGDPGVVGLWIEDCAVVQCDGELVNHGAMRWSRGTFTGATGIVNQTAGTLLIDDVGGFGCGNARLETTLTNFGTAEQHNDVRLGDGGRIIAGGEYRMITGSIIDDGDDNLFRTILLLRRQGASPGASAYIGVPYEQTISGNVLAETGKLQFYGGGTVAGGAWSIQADGEISIEAGTMTFGPIGGGPSEPSGLVNILGEGTFRIDGASTVVEVAEGHVLEIEIAANAAEREFDFEEGTLSGEIRNLGEMNWRGGTIAMGPGSVSNDGGIDIPSTGSRTLRGTLTNRGLITAGSLTVDGGQLHNEEEVLLFSGTITGPNGGRIINTGAIVKEGTLTHTIAARLTAQNGRVTVVAGTLVISGTIDEIDDGFLTGGRWEVATNATLSIPGVALSGLSSGAHVILESGAAFPAIESLVRNAGTVESCGAGRIYLPILLRNDGTMRVSCSSNIETDGAVTNGVLGDLSQTLVLGGPGDSGGFVIPTLINEGTLRPGGAGVAGVFALTGTLDQAATGVIEIDLAGSTPIDGHDQVQVDGDVTLAGTLDVRILPGYAPAGGETFTVLTVTNGTITGVFDGVTGAGAYDVSYTATTVELTLLQPPVPGDVNADGVVDFGDVLGILSAWGACPNGSPCPADLDGNRVVNFADLLLVLSSWS